MTNVILSTVIAFQVAIMIQNSNIHVRLRKIREQLARLEITIAVSAKRYERTIK